jgi:hypothetical protein
MAASSHDPAIEINCPSTDRFGRKTFDARAKAHEPEDEFDMESNEP